MLSTKWTHLLSVANVDVFLVPPRKRFMYPGRQVYHVQTKIKMVSDAQVFGPWISYAEASDQHCRTPNDPLASG